MLEYTAKQKKKIIYIYRFVSQDKPARVATCTVEGQQGDIWERRNKEVK